MLTEGDILMCFEAINPSQIYRVEHPAIVFQNLGYTCRMITLNQLEYLSDLSFLKGFKYVFLHRLPWTGAIDRLIHAARRFGTKIILDLDDYIFDPEVYSESGIFDRLDHLEKRLHLDMAARLRKTVLQSDLITVSTTTLQTAVKDMGKSCEVIPNAISETMIRQYNDDSNEEMSNRSGCINLGYLSGTSTHDRDFSVIQEAVDAVMDSENSVNLFIAGPLNVNPEFLEKHGNRIIRKPLVSWEQVHTLYRNIDINLAPLEGRNRFCAAKSAIKFLEAGILSIPTVATPTPAFRDAIRNGENGMLAVSVQDWRESLYHLCRSPNQRRSMGAHANQDVMSQFHLDTTKALWESILEVQALES